jgi:hypothetical protein
MDATYSKMMAYELCPLMFWPKWDLNTNNTHGEMRSVYKCFGRKSERRDHFGDFSANVTIILKRNHENML